MSGEGKIIVEIKNSHPVELLDLTQSLISFAKEYQDYAEMEFDGAYRSATRLYVKEIRTGSIITELVPHAPALLPLISDTNLVIGFVKHIKSGVDWLLKRGDAPKPDISKSTLQNIGSIVEPIAKDSSSQINIGTVVHNEAPVNLTINWNDANTLQNQIRKEIDLLKTSVVGLHEKVVMHWYQARNDATTSTGDRAIIESICDKAVKVIFDPDGLKAEILKMDENLFKHAFIVDVKVETVNNKPALYKVVSVHDKIEMDYPTNPAISSKDQT